MCVAYKHLCVVGDFWFTDRSVFMCCCWFTQYTDRGLSDVAVMVQCTHLLSSELVVVLVRHHSLPPFIWPTGLPVYTDSGSPLTCLSYYLQRRFRGLLTLTLQTALVTFTLTLGWGKGPQKALWRGSVKEACVASHPSIHILLLRWVLSFGTLPVLLIS